jgi:hypothetical protein
MKPLTLAAVVAVGMATGCATDDEIARPRALVELSGQDRGLPKPFFRTTGATTVEITGMSVTPPPGR